MINLKGITMTKEEFKKLANKHLFALEKPRNPFGGTELRVYGIDELYEALNMHVVVGQSEQLPNSHCTLNRKTCGKGSGCKYPHCHL